MNIKTRWKIHFTVVAVPFCVPLAAGAYWMWLQQFMALWFAASAAIGAIWWFVNNRLIHSNLALELLDISQSLEKTEQNKASYEQIQRISSVLRNSDPDLTSTQFYTQTLLEVMQAVAVQYYPQRKDALLEIKAPDLLKVIEMFAQELRVSIYENVPGSHIFSLNDIVRSRRLVQRGNELYRLFRIVSAGADPVSAMMREIKILTSDRFLSHSTGELKYWLIDAYIKKIGYYAIMLYSGNMVPDDNVFAKATRKTQQELDKIQHKEMSVSAEPLRILVLGQTNAGKSSLINALFGENKVETDVVPVREGLNSYHLQRPGFESAILLDCEGYGSDGCKGLFAKMTKEIIRSDLILLAVSATNAARDPDKKMLKAIEDCFKSEGKKKLPPVVMVLTHIDRMRPFKEWSPPYDVMNPICAKARSIRLMMDTIAKEMELKTDQVVPVSLSPGYEYNVEEGLIPAIFQQLDQANQMRYLRCLKEYQSQDQWRRLWTQSVGAGRFIAKTSRAVYNKASGFTAELKKQSEEDPLNSPAC
jgi:predicted GTPase